jgi:hypothetical protein
MRIRIKSKKLSCSTSVSLQYPWVQYAQISQNMKRLSYLWMCYTRSTGTNMEEFIVICKLDSVLLVFVIYSVFMC